MITDTNPSRRAPKILSVCLGGSVRSVTFANICKNQYAVDAIAASAIWNTNETFEMLCNWADYICLIAPRELPEPDKIWQKQWDLCPVFEDRFASKLRIIDVGMDIYGTPNHKDLVAKIAKLVPSCFPEACAWTPVQ